jgi:hypothetical protein
VLEAVLQSCEAVGLPPYQVSPSQGKLLSLMPDNVVRDGAVADARSRNPDVLEIRRLCERSAQDRPVSATAIQAAGENGYDGFLLALVRA